MQGKLVKMDETKTIAYIIGGSPQIMQLTDYCRNNGIKYSAHSSLIIAPASACRTYYIIEYSILAAAPKLAGQLGSLMVADVPAGADYSICGVHFITIGCSQAELDARAGAFFSKAGKQCPQGKMQVLSHEPGQEFCLWQKQVEAAALIGKIAFWELSLADFTTSGNNVWKKLLGIKTEKQDFDEWSQNIETDHYKDFMSKISAVARSEEYSFRHLMQYTPSGTPPLWLDIKCFGADYADDGRPAKIIGIAQDRTEEVVTQLRLKHQQANMSALLEHTDAQIWLVDKNMRIVAMNSQFRRSFGALFSISYETGSSFLEPLPPQAASKWTKLFDKAFHGNASFAMESIVTKNTERFFEIKLAPVMVEENITAVSCYMTEVTDQKRYEKMLKLAKQSAENSNAAKSRFLATMSHEIRTPLNAILGFAEIMESKEIAQENLAYLSSIKKSGKLLLNIINDVLDIAKIEAGKLSVSSQATDVYNILSELSEPIKFRCMKNGVAFAASISSIKDLMFLTDGFRLRQIVLNLLSNAAKFTKTGSVTCAASFQPAADGRGRLAITVTDTGIGMADEVLDAIFAPFFQSESHDSRSFEGTGLGLAISRELAGLLGATITADSIPGKGSRFVLEWDNIETAGQAQAIEAPAAYSKTELAWANALVVDDIAEHRAVLSSMIRMLGGRAAVAENAQQAIDILEASQPNLLLIDIKMPGTGGIELLQQIRKRTDWENIPAIAVTAQISALGADSSFSGVLLKPLQIESLAESLRKFEPVCKPAQNTLAQEITQLPEDARSLIMNSLSALEARQPKNMVRKLSAELESLSASYGLPELGRVGGCLYVSASSFDVKNLRESLAQLRMAGLG
jgi:PAS domain S-box-containing protein